MNLLRCLSPSTLGAACLFLAATVADAQEPVPLVRRIILPGESTDASARLKAADLLVEKNEAPSLPAGLTALAGSSPFMNWTLVSSAFANQVLQQDWSAALDEYQRIVYEDGDKLAMDEGGNGGAAMLRSVPVRRLCHLRIASAPPHALAQYRKRVDVLAEKLFNEGRAKHDSLLLKRVVRDLFCSRFGDRALDMLGDLAFERGDFAEAGEWWRMLALPASAARRTAPDRLVFPDPSVDLARVRAKQVLALAFAGQREQSLHELRAFRRLHSAARGQLGGVDGEYAATVADIIRRLPTMPDDKPWSTFAGSPTRNRVLASIPSPRSWMDGPTWRVGLPNPGFIERAYTFSRLAARLRYHPVIADDRVLVTDGRSVIGYDLLDGRLLFRYDVQVAHKLRFGLPPVDKAPRFSLSVADGRVYARLGDPAIGPGTARAQTILVCLALPTTGRDVPPGELRELWSCSPPEGSQFEGSPLIHDGRAYIASTRIENRRSKTSLHCYDARTGKLRWVESICDTSEFEETPPEPRYVHHLLTLAANRIVYCSHSGAVVAVDRLTGTPCWAVRYPARPLAAAASRPQELSPCLFQFDRLFVAPSDAARILCADPSTGQVLWEREGIQVIQLLGVSQGRLLFTERHGLRAVSALSGQGLWQQPGAGGSLPALGRGLLAGDLVFWPTRGVPQFGGAPDLPSGSVFALRQKDGEQLDDLEPTRLRQIQPGNMAFANGCLVVAGPDYLYGYVAPERLLRKLQIDAGRPRASAWSLYRLAQAKADAGDGAGALVDFSRAAKSDPQERRNNMPVRTLSLREKHALLMQQAQRTVEDKAKPATALRDACGPEFPPELRVSALLFMAERNRQMGNAEHLLDLQRKLIQDQSLRQVMVRTSSGNYCSAGAFITRNFGATMPDGRAQPKKLTMNKMRARRIATDIPVQKLSSPLLHAWELRAGRMLLPTYKNQSPSALFLFSNGELTCRHGADGSLRWRSALGFAPAWLGVNAKRVIAAGEHEIVSLNLDDGQRLWRFGSPFVQEATATNGRTTLIERSFAGFHLTSSHLILLLDRQELLAIALESGEPSWMQKAPRPERLGERPHFGSHFYCDDRLVLIQDSYGRRLAFKSDSGQQLHESEGSRPPWPYAPVWLDGDRFCLSAEGRLELLELSSGRELWSYTPLRVSLTGAAPQPIRTGNSLLALVPRNYGYELEKLDCGTGRPLWEPTETRLAGISACTIRINNDGSECFIASGRQLSCWDLSAGKPKWQKTLPTKSRRWELVLTRDSVLVYQATATQPPWTWVPTGAVTLGFPNPGLLENRPQALAVVVHDRASGRVLQQLEFRVPALHLQVLGGRLVISGPRRTWAFKSGS